MRNYGQFCPIARGSEILAERWTPIILRNVLMGFRTFNELAAGAPGLWRALLTRRLRELERAGVLEIRPKPDGHGSLYEPTPGSSCGPGARSSCAATCCPTGGWWSASTTRRSAGGSGCGCSSSAGRSRSAASIPAAATTWW
jgi:HxlR-like helix-turn-helix